MQVCCGGEVMVCAGVLWRRGDGVCRCVVEG